jgi:hypothetical protein
MSENENENENENEATVICDVDNPTPDNTGSIQVVATKDSQVAKIYYNFGADLESMIELFGDEVVFSYAKGQMVIRLQAAMRSRLSAGTDVASLMSEFKPGIALPKSPKDMNKATENYFMTLSTAEQDAMISKLMERKGA